MQRSGQNLNRNFSWAVFGLATLVTLVFFGVAGVLPLRSQSLQATGVEAQQSNGAPSASFEVASIKSDRSGRGGGNWGFAGLEVSATNVPAKGLIRVAYDMNDFQISGGPAWINSERFDLNAKVDDSMAAQFQKLSRDQKIDEIRPMLQSLLADRFKLRVTRATKVLPILVLVLAKDDSKLKALAVDPFAVVRDGSTFIGIGRDGQMSVQANRATLDIFANGLSVALGQKVTDETDVKGNYTFNLQWTDAKQAPAVGAPDAAFDRSLAAALQEELGLKLETTKGPVETITIDHVEEPSPN
jgi:uncharacterized protein (TIGR03435 family)